MGIVRDGSLAGTAGAVEERMLGKGMAARERAVVVGWLAGRHWGRRGGMEVAAISAACAKRHNPPARASGDAQAGLLGSSKRYILSTLTLRLRPMNTAPSRPGMPSRTAGGRGTAVGP